MNYSGKFGPGTSDSFPGAGFNIDAPAHQGGGDSVTIPDAHLLFSGDYSRSGADLIVSDQLHRVVVPGYFHGDKRPTLVSPDGAPLDPHVIEALAGHVQYAQAAGTAAAAAAKVVGHVVKMTGSASVVRNGVTIALNNGDNVLQNDVVQTGSGSSLGLVMIDGTTFNLSAGARLMLNDLTYEANSTSNASLFTLVQGAASFVAGQVAKTGDMKVGTPVATMGIRGTAVILDISAVDGKVSISVIDQRDGQVHAVQVYNTRGILIGTVTSNGAGLTLTPVANFEVIAQESDKTVAQVAAEFNAFQVLLQTYDAGKVLFPDLPQHTDANPNTPTRFAGSPTPDSPSTVYHSPTVGPAGSLPNLGTGTPVVIVSNSPGTTPTGTPVLGADPIVVTVVIPPTPLPFVVTPPTVSRISGEGGDHFGPVMSADGHFIVYDPDGSIFLFNQQTRTTITIAEAGNGFTYSGQTISADGHHIVFQGSNGTQSWVFIYNNDPTDVAHYGQTVQLVAGGAPAISGDGSRIVVEHGGNSIGIYDQQGHVIATVTPAAIGETGAVWLPAISADGHLIAFWNTDAATPGGSGHLFVYDLSTGTATEIASTATDAGTSAASFSADGRYVVYQSDAPGGHSEIYLYDLSTGQIVFHTENASGASYNPVISPDGNFIIFASDAQLTAGDSNSVTDTYVVDVSNPNNPVFNRVSNLDNGSQPDAVANLGVTISAGGLYVAFASSAAPGTGDIFFVDPTSGRSAIIQERANSPAILTAGGIIALTGDHNGATLGVADPSGRFAASFNAQGDIVWSFSEPKSDFAALLPGQRVTQDFVITLTNASGTTTIPVRVVVYDADLPATLVVANPGTIAGDNNDNSLTGTAGNDILQGFGGNDSLVGLTGVDRAVYTDATGGITVDLAAGTVTGPGVGADTLIGIEEIQGSNFVDHYSAAGFTGDSGVPGVPVGFNSFEGMAGDDIITGNVNVQGQALTRISYASASAAVTVDFCAGTATGNASVGTDHFTNVGSVIGSGFGDTLRGSNNAPGTVEQFDGRGGDDTLDGRGGFDQAIYSNDPNVTTGITVNMFAGTVDGDGLVGHDTLVSIESVIGTRFGDIYNALNFVGFNGFQGLGGDDYIVGNGWTELGYYSATSSVTVDMKLGTADGDASVGHDTFSGVNEIGGSNFSDSLHGDDDNNILVGLGGDDLLDGRGGEDALIGESGADIFVYAAGYGADIIVDFSHSDGDRIDLSGVPGVHSLADLYPIQDGPHTVITFSAGNTLTLQGISPTSLVESDFIFAAPPNEAPAIGFAPTYLHFDGGAAAIGPAATANVGNGAEDGVTLAGWANWDGQGNIEDAQLLFYNGSTSDSGFGVNGFVTECGLALKIQIGGIGSLDTGVTLAAGQWHNIALTHVDGIFTLYVDGVAEFSVKADVNGIPGPSEYPAFTMVGGVTIEGEAFQDAGFHGSIADVSVWNAALTEAQVQAAQFTSLTGNESGLAAYFPLNDGSGTTAADLANVEGGLTLLGEPGWTANSGDNWLAGGVTINEDTPLRLTSLSVSDADAASAPISVTLSVQYGTLAFDNADMPGLTGDLDGSDGTLSLTGSQSAINAALANGVVYTPEQDYSGLSQLTVTANDQGHNGSGGALTATLQVDIDVAPANEAPDFTGESVGANYTGTAVTIATEVSASDIDSADYAGGSLTATVTAGGHEGDTLSIAESEYIHYDASGHIVSFDSDGEGNAAGFVDIGTLTNNVNSLTIALNANATDDAVAWLAQAIQFANVNPNAVAPGTRTVTYTLDDGGGTANGGHNTDYFNATVNVPGTNQAPVAGNDNVNVRPDYIAIASTLITNDIDPDGDTFVISGAAHDGTPATPGDGAYTIQGQYGTMRFYATEHSSVTFGGFVNFHVNAGDFIYAIGQDADGESIPGIPIYDLQPGQTLAEAFTYTITDSHGAISSPATVTVTFEPSLVDLRVRTPDGYDTTTLWDDLHDGNITAISSTHITVVNAERTVEIDAKGLTFIDLGGGDYVLTGGLIKGFHVSGPSGALFDAVRYNLPAAASGAVIGSSDSGAFANMLAEYGYDSHGSAGADVLLGGDLTDYFDTGGGADTIVAGEGNDVITIHDNAAWDIDGGDGVDTVKLSGAFDLTAGPEGQHLTNIEIIDLNRTDANTIVVRPEDLYQVNAGHEGRILGNGSDTVVLAGEHYGHPGGQWALAQSGAFYTGDSATPGVSFDMYEYRDQGLLLGTLYVEQGVTVDRAPVILTNDLQTGGDDSGGTIVSQLSIADDQADGLTVTVVAAHGTLAPVGGPSPINNNDEGEDGILGGSGSLASVNQMLAEGWIYTPNENAPSTDMVTMTIADSLGGSDTVNFIFNQAGEGPVNLQGTSGKDVIFATGYSDSLTGGAGADQFVFTADSGEDTITDFRPGQDRIDLVDDTPFTAGDQGSFNYWLTSSGQVVEQDGSTLITLGDDSIRLSNVSRASLHMNDFILHPGGGGGSN